MNVIFVLWNGNIAPCEHCGAQNSHANMLYTRVRQSGEALRGSLSEEHHGLLESYGQCWEDYLLRMMELAFREGIILGTRLGGAVFSEEG